MSYVIGNKRDGALAVRENMDHAAECLLTMLKGTGEPMSACIVAAAHVIGSGPEPRLKDCLLGWYIVKEWDDAEEQRKRILDEIRGLTLEQARHFLEDGEALEFKAIHNQLAVEDVYEVLAGLISE
jgi:hypothetical protein